MPQAEPLRPIDSPDSARIALPRRGPILRSPAFRRAAGGWHELRQSPGQRPDRSPVPSLSHRQRYSRRHRRPARRNSARFSRTAMIIATRSGVTPLVFRLAAPMTLDAVQRCTSTEAARRDPCIVAVTTLPLGGPPGPCCSRRIIFRDPVNSGQAAAGHFEKADLVRPAETVFHAADNAVGSDIDPLRNRRLCRRYAR